MRAMAQMAAARYVSGVPSLAGELYIPIASKANSAEPAHSAIAAVFWVKPLRTKR